MVAGKTASELHGIFLPVKEPVGGPIDATLKSDPWARSITKLTPEQYARRRVELAVYDAEDSAIRIYIPGGPPMARASILRRWLLNGTLSLSAPEIDVVIGALDTPINEPIDPLATPQDVMERRGAVDVLRGQLMLERARR